MADTQYQLLYRYINATTNNKVTNSLANKYEKIEEFVTVDHQFMSTIDTERIEGEMKKEQMIIDANSAENPKTDMLFAYYGTHKIKHKKWLNPRTGYVLRDWKNYRNLIGNEGDFSKPFTTVKGKTPESGGTVVCPKEVFDRYFEYGTGKYSMPPGNYTTLQANTNLTNATIFKLKDDTWQSHAKPGFVTENIEHMYSNVGAWGSPGDCSQSGYMTPSATPMPNLSVYYANIAIDKAIIEAKVIECYRPFPVTGGEAPCGGGHAWLFIDPNKQYVTLKNFYDTTDNLYNEISFTANDIQTMIIPGHYEETDGYPYLIKDTYKRIELDPWFVNSTYSSLTAALEKAKLLISHIGVENVQLIKIVPFEQFIKID